MPFVPKRDGSSHSHYVHPRAVVDIHRGPSFPSTDGTNLSNHERNIASTAQNAEAELNHAFVLGMGLFLFLVLGYLSRRQIRCRLTRLAHALSVRGPASQFIQIHLHAVHYSPLHDLDTITSPIDFEGGIDHLEVATHANDEPAPPYSPQPSNMRERRSRRSLHITVPVIQSTVTPSNAPGQEATPLARDAAPSNAVTSSSMASNASPDQPATEGSSRTRSLSNAGVLRLVSPVASRFDAYFRPYRHVSIPPHQTDGETVVATIGDTTYLPNVSNQAESFMSTESPCVTPPPQYTITIHSSHRLTRCDSAGRLASVPDIVLSPVPWLPREHIPQSPPHYLAIPSRKSRSRQRTGFDSTKVDPSKLLPAIPSSQDEPKSEKRSRKSKGSEVKVRHVFSSPMALQTPALVTKSVVPTSPVPRESKPKQMPRSSTYPLPKRVLPPLPPPRPVLPMDLEAVYPTHLEENETAAKTDTTTSGSGHADSWRWPNWPSSASTDRGLARTESESKRDSYGIRKGVYVAEKGEWSQAVRSMSDSEDVPLAQGLLKAIKRRQLMLETIPGRHNRGSPAFDVSQALRKGLFGGLSALAATARLVIERELDSDEEEEMGEEEEMINEKGEIRHRNFVARELDAASAFVIGEED